LFRKIILASTSIPGVFPPVYFDVEVNGKEYDEMHVDGGVITGTLGYGHLFDKQAGKADRKTPCRLYIIRNGKLDVEYKKVPRKCIGITGRTLTTSMKAHSWNDLLRLKHKAAVEGVNFNYVSIPASFQAASEEIFDQTEMNRLFDLGFEMAKAGKWCKGIPGSDHLTKGFLWCP
jgi:hypothetical protein